MKHRRKIWSLPIAVLALALMLVGGIVATGVIQAFGDAPKMVTQIPDKEIVIGADPAGSTSVVIDFEDADGNQVDGPDDDDNVAVDPAFTDVGTDAADTAADPLAYTVLTYNYKVAFVALSNGNGASPAILRAWWDSLGAGVDADNQALPDTDCSKRAARLGFSAAAPVALDDVEVGTTPPHTVGRAAVGTSQAIPARGLCGDYDIASANGVNLTIDNPATTTVAEPILSGADAILQAFHWDMLNAAEMAAAAKSGDLPNYSGYAKTFADLTPTQRVNVETLYNPLNVLARGSGDLTLDNLGIDSDTNNNDLPGDAIDPDGEPGTTKITVKVSDDTGRHIPPPNGSGTVGQSFEVTASLTPTGAIGQFAVPGTVTANANPSTTYVTEIEGSGAGVNYVEAIVDISPPTIHRYELTIGTDTEGSIARVHVRAGEDLEQHNQKIEVLLRGDDRFQVSRANRALQAADITLRSGATLVRDEVIPLTLQANELGNVGANNAIIDFNVLVVEGGEAPMLDTAGLDAHFAANAVKVREHKAEAEDVATEGLPFNFASFASHGGGQAITYAISPDPVRGDFLETKDQNTGVVTLKDPRALILTDIVEADSDEEPDNAIKPYTLSANDGTRTVALRVLCGDNDQLPAGRLGVTQMSKHVDEDEDDDDPDDYVVTVEKSFKKDDRGEVHWRT